MSDIPVHEEQILHAEDVRVKVRTNMRAQSIPCQDDESIDTMADKIPDIQSFNARLNKSISGAIVDDTIETLPYPNFLRDCQYVTSVRMRALKNLNDFGNQGNYAFYGCSRLASADFPLVTSVGQYAFSGCTSLASADFPLVTSVGQSAFSGCTSLEEYNFPRLTNLSANEVFRNCTSLASADFPLVTSVGQYAFSGCTSLEEIILPRLTGAQIPSNFFTSDNANALKLMDFGKINALYGGNYKDKLMFKYFILRKTSGVCSMPSASDWSGTENFNCYVPSNLISSYQSATNWSSKQINWIALEGSRFESLDWKASCTETCSLDTEPIKVLDTETVGMFKHTEGLAHVYENGVEPSDSALVKDKVLTTTP